MNSWRDEAVADLIDWLEDVLVEYDEAGQLFGTSGAGAYFLARHIAREVKIKDHRF